MEPNNLIVRQLIKSLGMIILHSSTVSALDGQAVGNILASLKHYSSEIPEVREVLSALVYSLRRHPDTLLRAKCKELSMALWGLQSMSSSCEQVQEIISILTLAMSAKSHLAMPEEVLYAIGGLRRMTETDPEVLPLLQVLASTATGAVERIERSAGVVALGIIARLDEVAVGSALFGLQSMGECSQVLAIIAAASRFLNHANISLSDRALASSLYGMSCY
jgi:hypothetical protein